jgi:hypothetical protein
VQLRPNSIRVLIRHLPSPLYQESPSPHPSANFSQMKARRKHPMIQILAEDLCKIWGFHGGDYEE